MSTSDWAELLDEPWSAQETFSAPPELDDCTLDSCHIDERATSVTLGFDARRIPDGSGPGSAESQTNALEFFVTFTSVTGLRVRGWGGTAGGSVRMSRSESGGIEVTVDASAGRISFHARAALLSRARAYRASDAE
ncbi:Imm50 family immunity protein [Streptomyces sp. NPDC086835]|uniref:Imm50 family immunity protein n=1 Tax=Streptomyces sp. NPDC086835 TaxID=3365761 RepID=UPI00381E1450